jgi:hypothetical protein
MEINQIIIFTLLFIFFTGCSQVNEKENSEIKVIETSNSLTEDEIEALKITLEDEYKAEMIYLRVMEDYGEIKPFSNIIKAEQKHSSRLIELFLQYNLEIPVNTWYDKVPTFTSISEACEAGVQAEIDNVALYDNLFEKVNNQDIIRVFTSLRDASKYNHLPAFKRCS